MILSGDTTTECALLLHLEFVHYVIVNQELMSLRVTESYETDIFD